MNRTLMQITRTFLKI